MKDKIFDVTKAIEGVWVKLSDWVDSVVLNIPNFLLALVVFIAFIFIAKYVGILFHKFLSRYRIQLSVQNISTRIVKFIVICIGFFVALDLLHLDKMLTSILAGAGVATLAIGLALQGTLNNTVSGVILSFLPEIQIGDWVETSGYAGEVLEVNLRNIVIKESDNNHVVIPNSKIVEDTFKNFSRTARMRIMVECGVGYESDLDKVEQITTEAIQNTFQQEGNEKVEFAYTEFGDSSINFVVRFWVPGTKQFDDLIATHKAVLNIKKAFDKNDINIPFPIRTLDFGKNKFRSETLHIASEEKD